jgi:hypothetical protein
VSRLARRQGSARLRRRGAQPKLSPRAWWRVRRSIRRGEAAPDVRLAAIALELAERSARASWLRGGWLVAAVPFGLLAVGDAAIPSTGFRIPILIVSLINFCLMTWNYVRWPTWTARAAQAAAANRQLLSSTDASRDSARANDRIVPAEP